MPARAQWRADLDAFLNGLDFVLVPVSFSQARIARDAYHRFGRGNHPAGLNFGDCFAYALAKERDLPLLFKGQRFRQDRRPPGDMTARRLRALAGLHGASRP